MESIILSSLLPLLVLIGVRKQGGTEDRSKRADILGYTCASSPLLVSVYSCISSASLRPRLGVSCGITQVTHLEAACCAGKEEMLLLCNLDTCEKKNNSDSVTMKYCLVLLFLHVSTPISLKRYEIFMLLSTLIPLQLHCRGGFSSVFHGVGSSLTDFLPTISFHTMRFYLQYIPTCLLYLYA